MPGQNFLSNAAGKLFSNNKLSRRLRSVAQPMVRYRQHADVDPQFGKRMGEKLLFDKILNLTADVTNGAIIAEGQAIPRAGFTVIQGECLAIPSGIAIPFTEELESFSEFDVRDPIESRLADHMAKSMDYRAYAKLAANNVCYIPTGTDDTPTATWDLDGSPNTAATRDIQAFDFKEIVDAMKKGKYVAAGGTISASNTAAPVPPFDGVNWQFIGSVDFCRALKDDPDWEKAQYYGNPERLFSAEVGRFYGARGVEDNHILTTINGKKGGAFFLGADALMECVVTPEEIRVGIPGDFGRDMAIAWYYLGGFALPWNFVATTEPENRVVRLTSS